MKNGEEKIMAAVEIFKAKFPGATGFKFRLSETNGNEVDVFSDAGLDTIINIRTIKARFV